MANKRKNSKVKRKILIIITAILVAIIPLCFMYSLIILIIQPADIFIVENRKDISRRNGRGICYKRRNSSSRTKL